MHIHSASNTSLSSPPYTSHHVMSRSLVSKQFFFYTNRLRGCSIPIVSNAANSITRLKYYHLDENEMGESIIVKRGLKWDKSGFQP